MALSTMLQANYQNQKQTALLLDRDGVINNNCQLKTGYVRSLAEWQWLPQSLEALVQLSKQFYPLCIITNQQGIGKNLMTESDLADIHAYLIDSVNNAGGRIDGIYYCPHLASVKCNCRKPQIGLANQVQTDFPEIDFSNSYLVGDSLSDLEVGHKIGSTPVLITTKHKCPQGKIAQLARYKYHNLWAFAECFI